VGKVREERSTTKARLLEVAVSTLHLPPELYSLRGEDDRAHLDPFTDPRILQLVCGRPPQPEKSGQLIPYLLFDPADYENPGALPFTNPDLAVVSDTY
jgi:hypothetical protein